MITALQVVRLPNIKVVYLVCCLVIYDVSLLYADSGLYSRLLLYFFAARLSMTSSGFSYHH